MKNDKLFIFAFFVTLFVMAALFFSNVDLEKLKPSALRPYYRKEKEEKPSFERIDYSRIKQLIKENKLSDKEAYFYTIIEDN
ncbi:MAG: hypothetical protein JSV34_06045 [Candidatus Omnitrophota bacterium]|nr:MAG: hypothetical protein JSV34_06045 [Candidatus Omnitrophota bacterium]